MPFKINLNDELAANAASPCTSIKPTYNSHITGKSPSLTPTLSLSSSLSEFIHSSVRYIEMSNTHLQSVDDETFQGLRLKTLKLIDNELQDISERSFRWVHEWSEVIRVVTEVLSHDDHPHTYCIIYYICYAIYICINMYEYSDDATLFAGLFKCQRVFPPFFLPFRVFMCL